MDGRWRGQFTWAATTLIDQWSIGASATGKGVNRYVALSFDELVGRATALIAAISAADQPQQPQVYASAQGKASPVLDVVGDPDAATTPEPVRAPGMEWGPGTSGVITNGAGATVGAYQVGTAAAPQSYYWFTGGVPTGNTSPLTFTSGPLPTLTGMTRYKSSTAPFGNYGSQLYPGPALFNAVGTVACQLLPTVIAWFKVVGSPPPTPPVYLTSVTALTQSGGPNLFQVPVNGQIWSSFDSIIQG